MKIFTFDSKVTDYFGRLVSYSNYLFLIYVDFVQNYNLLSTYNIQNLRVHFHLGVVHFLYRVRNWLVWKIFEYVDNVKCYCDQILNRRGFFNTAASFVKVIKKKLSCTKKE